MESFEFYEGSIPLLISMPHNGTLIPDHLKPLMSEAALKVPDTDWYMDRLYNFARQFGCHMLKPLYSRYVVDLNRSPGNKELYPGQNSTGVCPLYTFADEKIYIDSPPDSNDIQSRLKKYYQPYHDKLSSWIESSISANGLAVIYEAHSIKSIVPKLFKGTLPDINLGTNDGLSCALELAQLVWGQTQNGSYSSVMND